MTNYHYDLPTLAEEALEAFWHVIVQRFPEAKSGDLSTGQTLDLKRMAEEAIEEWIANNVTGGER